MTRALLLTLAFGTASLAADAPMRYNLEPGRELAYTSSSTFKFGEGKSAGEHRNRSEWTVWVLSQNADGSSRVLARSVTHFVAVYDGKPGKDRPQTQLVTADVFPDGRIPPNPSIQFRGSPATLFPRLPADTAEAKSGWGTRDDGETVTATPTGPNEFAAVRVGPMDKIYLSTSEIAYTFDPERGLISKAKTENSQGYGFNGKGAGTVELTSVKAVPAAELAKLAANSRAYFAATTAYSDTVAAADKLAPDLAKTQLDKAVATLTTAAEGVTQPDLKAQLAETIKGHGAMARYTLDDIARREKVVGKPAYDFEGTTLAGKPTTLADFKGKVVVMDFWYRGCGWCIKAMPQINELAADFKSDPVAVVGMNTDSKKSDAEFVIKEMGLNYPTVCIKHELSGKFGVQGFPTLVILDQKGVVRGLHVGYSPTLREDVAKKVRELLAEKP